MQRAIFTAVLLIVAGSVPALAQNNPYYYQRTAQAPAARPVYQQQPRYAPQQHYVQPQDDVSERPNLGGGFIEFVFSGGQTRYGRPVAQPAQRGQQPYVTGQPEYGVPQPLYGQPPLVQASLPPQQPVMDPRYLRQVVDYGGKEAPGTIVINTPDKFLYLVQENGRAVRYGIGVGRPGFTWAGTHEVTAKREWPDWRPPKEMLARRPELPHYMAGGPENPLGARAMYLGSTLYRIHGSNEPWTIGTQVSSGCIRMRNEDVIDLYERVPVGTKVLVI